MSRSVIKTANRQNLYPQKHNPTKGNPMAKFEVNTQNQQTFAAYDYDGEGFAHQTHDAGGDETPTESGRTVHLSGRVSSYNIYQVLQLIEVGDSVVTDNLTTGRNLMGIVLTEAFCDHLDVESQYGVVQIWRTS